MLCAPAFQGDIIVWLIDWIDWLIGLIDWIDWLDWLIDLLDGLDGLDGWMDGWIDWFWLWLLRWIVIRFLSSNSYGFSEAPKTPSLGPSTIAEIFIKLMHILGYDEYIAQGGDWGSVISTFMAIKDPRHCKLLHLNMFVVNPATTGVVGFLHTLATLWKPNWFLSAQEVRGVNGLTGLPDQIGYMVHQATRPQVIPTQYAMVLFIDLIWFYYYFLNQQHVFPLPASFFLYFYW